MVGVEGQSALIFADDDDGTGRLRFIVSWIFEFNESVRKLCD